MTQELVDNARKALARLEAPRTAPLTKKQTLAFGQQISDALDAYETSLNGGAPIGAPVLSLGAKLQGAQVLAYSHTIPQDVLDEVGDQRTAVLAFVNAAMTQFEQFDADPYSALYEIKRTSLGVAINAEAN